MFRYLRKPLAVAFFAGAAAGMIPAAIISRVALYPENDWFSHSLLGFEIAYVVATFVAIFMVSTSETSDSDDEIATLSDAIRQDPTDHHARLKRGAVHLRNRNYDQAIVDLSEAIRIAPDDLDAYSLRADAQVEKGDFKSEVANYDYVLRVTPDDIVALRSRAMLYKKIGETEKSELDLANAEELSHRK